MNREIIPLIIIKLTVEGIERVDGRLCIPAIINRVGRTRANKRVFTIKQIIAKVSGSAYPPVVGILL